MGKGGGGGGERLSFFLLLPSLLRLSLLLELLEALFLANQKTGRPEMAATAVAGDITYTNFGQTIFKLDDSLNQQTTGSCFKSRLPEVALSDSRITNQVSH